MQGRVQKWGNSLAVRIPRAFAAQIGLLVNSDVDIFLDHGTLVVRPAPRVNFDLSELLAGVTDKNLHTEVDDGGPVGGELW